MLRDSLLLLSRSGRVKRLVETLPVTNELVGRYVPGEKIDDVVGAAARLADEGLFSTIDYLGEDTTDRSQADATTAAYVDLLAALAAAGLSSKAEVSVKLSAVGQAIPGEGRALSLDHARTICRAARNAGTTVTIDMEDHTTTDATLATLRELRKDFPETGGVLQSYLPRTERDARALAVADSRIRLCKGAYAEPDDVAYQRKVDVDLSYVRCLKVLFAGEGYPMVATHDPRMIDIATSLARRHGRRPGTYEYQMLYGIRPEEQRRLAAGGEKVRVYVPYGEEWYGYLMRRLAERPANLAFFARSLVSKK